MKILFSAALLLIATIACSSLAPTPTADIRAIYTSAAKTIQAETPQTPTITLTPRPTWTASSTAGPTITPQPSVNTQALGYMTALQAAQSDWYQEFLKFNEKIQDMAASPALYFDGNWKAGVLSSLEGLRRANDAIRDIPEPPELLRPLDILVGTMVDDTERLINDTSKFLVDISYADIVISDIQALNSTLEDMNTEMDRLLP